MGRYNNKTQLVNSCRYCGGCDCDFSIRCVPVRFRFTKFVLGSNGGIKSVMLVEDSHTVGPSLITVMMEYLLSNSNVVNLTWEWGRRGGGT